MPHPNTERKLQEVAEIRERLEELRIESAHVRGEYHAGQLTYKEALPLLTAITSEMHLLTVRMRALVAELPRSRRLGS
jgi:hypothetical protein